MTGKVVRCAVYTRKSSEEGLDAATLALANGSGHQSNLHSTLFDQAST